MLRGSGSMSLLRSAVTALFRNGRGGQHVLEVVILEADGEAAVNGTVVLVADKIVPAGGEVEVLEDLVFRAGLEVGAAIPSEAEGLEGEFQFVVQGEVVDADAAGRFQQTAPENDVLVPFTGCRRGPIPLFVS
jgi:hypothetical protein